VLLSLILTQVLSAGRSEALLAANLRNAAVAEAIADGAVQETVFHLLAHDWAPRGAHVLRIGRGAAEITIDDLFDRINPNTAGPQVLRAMLGLCGADAAQAAVLAQAVLSWRGDTDATTDALAAPYRAAGLPYAPLGKPMQSVDEMALVAGVTPAMFACLAPHLSLYQDNDPDPRSPDAFVARVAALAARASGTAIGVVPPSPTGPTAVQITAVASAPGGRFVRRATVRLSPSDDGLPFRILLWEAPPA
jgi:general secretion pathway protein K